MTIPSTWIHDGSRRHDDKTPVQRPFTHSGGRRAKTAVSPANRSSDLRCFILGLTVPLGANADGTFTTSVPFDSAKARLPQVEILVNGL